jgi:hypothetical protein
MNHGSGHTWSSSQALTCCSCRIAADGCLSNGFGMPNGQVVTLATIDLDFAKDNRDEVKR